MPLYEYKCENCGDVFELIQKFSDAPIATHEKCGGAVHRILSAPALQFKGSGWYVNDYAKSGATPPKNGSDGKPDGKPDGAAPAKTDSGSTSSSGDSAPASTPASSDKPAS